MDRFFSEFCTDVEVVDVITCDKFFSDRLRDVDSVGGSNIQGSHRLSQWLLTQGWRDCARLRSTQAVTSSRRSGSRHSGLYHNTQFGIPITCSWPLGIPVWAFWAAPPADCMPTLLTFKTNEHCLLRRHKTRIS